MDVIHVQTQMKYGHELNFKSTSSQILKEQYAIFPVQLVKSSTQQLMSALLVLWLMQLLDVLESCLLS